MYNFRNLVFEGGGVKGIAYVGALEALQARNILDDIERVGGTSAGAINAAMLALGYDVEETREVLWSLDFTKMMDDSWGVIRDAHRLFCEYGLYKGDYFKIWIEALIYRKTGSRRSTFADLKRTGRRDLYVIGANLSTGFSEIFSAEHTPDMPVAEAVRISMSIPLFFAAVKNNQGLYVDGGLFDNYPVKLFDRARYAAYPENTTEPGYYKKANRRKAPADRFIYNKETLGFRLDSTAQIAAFKAGEHPAIKPIKDFCDYLRALMTAVLNVQDNAHLHSDDWRRTVYIDTLGVSAVDFDITDDLKDALIASGAAGTNTYFTWYDASASDRRAA